MKHLKELADKRDKRLIELGIVLYQVCITLGAIAPVYDNIKDYWKHLGKED